ncbi:hypothetical protein HNP48_005732 [Acidovorax soli]|uniref:DUF3108 domain-containing protein n=1 Tax=Acidovorax soli TaxID=592050 RepID=A0A7X0PJC1_9BURK|nr:hypothetical protein [Acidovorax soli]MBB6563015.1 hypothetical protein [Acidovorax soli]
MSFIAPKAPPPHSFPWPAVRRIAAAALAGCATLATASGKPGSLPLSDTPFPAAQATIAWVGTGLAHVFANGQWQRAPAHDYDFSVTQRRYAQHWESVKVQHRRHGAYDGSAGARDQVHYFRVDYPASTGTGSISARLSSSMGDGTGQIDGALREGALEMAARGVSMFAPFNHYRITQQYRYEEGLLTEQVELFKRSGNSSDTPFMKFEERATLLAPQRMAGAPHAH